MSKLCTGKANMDVGEKLKEMAELSSPNRSPIFLTIHFMLQTIRRPWRREHTAMRCDLSKTLSFSLLIWKQLGLDLVDQHLAMTFKTFIDIPSPTATRPSPFSSAGDYAFYYQPIQTFMSPDVAEVSHLTVFTSQFSTKPNPVNVSLFKFLSIHDILSVLL